jgi:HK97 family phage portal protein
MDFDDLYEKRALQSPDSRGWTRIFDWAPGAWQRHEPYGTGDDVWVNPTVFSCITLRASDIGKLRPQTQAKTGDGIWVETETEESAILRRPNKYQNHIQFKEWWMYSKLTRGNTYALKVRDGRDRIIGLQLLDPSRTLPLVSESGDVFYQLDSDNLAGLSEGQIVVPASEIIHDRMNCLFHPLVGLSPIYACAVAANQGNAIQSDSKSFFENGAQPGGMLTAPGAISDSTATRLQQQFNANYGGENKGKVAVAGDGLTYASFRMTSVDAQLIEQLGMTEKTICSVFHVPPYKVGVGPMPTHDNIEALTQDYYSQCLQIDIESMELALAEGLGLKGSERIELDLDGLFRMDSERKARTLSEAVRGSVMTVNAALKKQNLPPVEGGDTIYMQQQNYSLAALAKRDAQEDPFSTGKANPAQQALPPPVEENDAEKAIAYLFTKSLAA